MSGQPWLKYAEASTSDAPQSAPEPSGSQPWMKYQAPAESPSTPESDPNTSHVTAGATGLIKGAIPFASSFAGAGKAAMDAITGVRGPLAGGSLGDIADDYHQAKDQFESESDAASDRHPITSGVGNLAGAAMNPVLRAAGALAGKGLGKLGQTVSSNFPDKSEAVKQAIMKYAPQVGRYGGAAVGGALGGHAAPATASAGAYAGEKAGQKLAEYLASKGESELLGGAAENVGSLLGKKGTQDLIGSGGPSLMSPIEEQVKEAIQKRRFDPFTKRAY